VRRIAPSAARPIALCGLLLALGAAAPRFVPDPEHAAAPGAPRLAGETWIAESAAVVLRVQWIDDAQRRRYLDHVTQLDIDPFASPPGQPARFVSFVLEIENHGTDGLAFNPRDCWLHDDRSPGPGTVFGLGDLGTAYRLAELQLPAAYERVAAAVLENPLVVPPGGKVSGLLLYRARSPKAKRLRLDLAWTASTGAEARCEASWRRSGAPS